MNRIRNGIIYMCVVMMVIGLFIGCSASDKPSEDIMKNIIRQFIGVDINDKSELMFDKFTITNGFFSKNKGAGGESTPYNIEVDYIISYIPEYYLRDKKYEIKLLQDIINNYKEYWDQNRDDVKELIISKTKEIEDLTKQKPVRQQIVRDNDRFSFSKKGDKWYGKMRWE
jgi:hypothetical protein